MLSKCSLWPEWVTNKTIKHRGQKKASLCNAFSPCKPRNKNKVLELLHFLSLSGCLCHLLVWPLSFLPPFYSDSAVTSDDLLSWLHPFCGDASLPVRPRIDVLQILESNFSLQDSDVRLLLLYRTQAVLRDREVSLQLWNTSLALYKENSGIWSEGVCNVTYILILIK